MANKYITHIELKREKLEKLDSDRAELHEDIKHAQSLLFLELKDELANKGIKEGAEVFFTPAKTKHKITVMWLHRDSNKMMVMLEPEPKLGLFEQVCVDDIKLISKQVKKVNNARKK